MKPTPILFLPPSTAERVRAKITSLSTVTVSGCWEWGGRLDRKGYGKFRLSIDGALRETGAHRAAWLAYRGAIPNPSLQTDHLCRNRRCCNPSHLELVTNQENALRSVAAAGPGGRGRRKGGRRDECIYGHPLSGDNLHVGISRAGYVVRTCIQCRRRRSREHKARLRDAA